MGFDWSLDGGPDGRSAAQDDDQDAIGLSAFEALGLTSSVQASSASPAIGSAQPPFSSSIPSRRELRMAALTRPAPANDQRRSRAAEVASPVAVRRGAASSRPAPSRPAERSLRHRVLPKVLSFGAMLGAGALLIATSVPANALMTTNADVVVPIAHVQAQSLAEVNAKAVAQTSTRDKYTVVSLAEQMQLRFMSSNWAYTNDPNGTIQWPFPIQVPIATGFGPRQVAGCSFCSTFHEGVDFDPGQGVAIGAIADGVVSQVVNSHAGLGNHVVVDHVINGQQVQSVYAHMLDGSIRVVVGQPVKVTEEIGQVGSTGESTGAHLHLEVHVNNVPIDPFAWLKANAN